MHWLWVLIIGAIIGAIAGAITSKGKSMGWIANIVAGLVGSSIGEAILGSWGPQLAGMAIIPSIIGAVIVVCVLSPKIALVALIHCAAIRVGNQEQVDVVVIQQPGHIRVHAIIGEQVLREAGVELWRCPFTRVDSTHDKNVRFNGG